MAAAAAGGGGARGGRPPLEALRALVKDCLAKHLYAGAAFFADKLVTLSGGAPADVYLLAQAHFVGGAPRRALWLLLGEGAPGRGLVEQDPRFRYLAAQCHAQSGDWAECLKVLGDGDVAAGPGADELLRVEGGEALPEGLPCRAPGSEIRTGAAVAVLRARALAALDDRARATEWYKLALRADPFCFEAFEALVQGHMLNSAEEAELLASLGLEGDDGWLACLYAAKAKKYGRIEAVEDLLQGLEAPAPPPGEEPPLGAPSGAGGAAGPAGSIDHAVGQGWGLRGNADVVTARAELLYESGDYQACYDLTQRLLQGSSLDLPCLPVHLAAGVELKKQNDLFLLGHKLTEDFPDRATSWYAVGCYYLVIGQHDSARRHFSRATATDPSHAASWVGFGHAFAAQDESDQAMAAYRTAARLFSGCHLPVLCIGMEYMRTNNLALAEEFFKKAVEICPKDPLVHNELGVLAFRQNHYEQAQQAFELAISLLPKPIRTQDSWSSTLLNLGHALRKQGHFNAALRSYQQALSLAPRSPGIFSAIGFTQHLQGCFAQAIDMYHNALSLRPDDTFTADMLQVALQEETFCSLDDLSIR